VVIAPSECNFGYERCKSCGVHRTVAKLGLDSESWEPNQVNHRFNWLGERVYGINSWTRLRYIKRFLKGNSGKVLDYGCGRGDLLNKFHRMGWQVFGAEYSEATSREVRKIHRDILLRSNFDHETISYYPDSNFDLVTSFHNLEHLVDPRLFIENCSRVLKRGGCFVLEVPNVDSWQSRLTGSKWIYLDPRNHTFHFTPLGLRGLLEGYHFAIERETFLAFWMGTIGMTSALINVFRKDENSFFHQMKEFDSYSKLILEGILFSFVYPVGVILELMSVFAKSGSVVRIVAVRS